MYVFRKLFVLMGRFIGNVIDFFYPPFKRYFSLQFFRYGATGSLNLVFSWFSYFFIYQIIIRKRMVNLGFVTLSAHTASMAVNFVLILLTGFFLQKYVTFTASELKGKKQLLRYIEVGLLNLFLSYVGLKLMVEVMGVFPSISNAIVSIIITILSYFLQTKYTFRIKNDAEQK